MSETMVVNDKSYSVIRLLGKGKGGYSYLATDSSGILSIGGSNTGQKRRNFCDM